MNISDISLTSLPKFSEASGVCAHHHWLQTDSAPNLHIEAERTGSDGLPMKPLTVINI